MKKLTIVLVAFLMSGCALTDFAKDYLTEMQDTNRYEQARETATNICDQHVLDRLDKFLGGDISALIDKKCDEKRQTPQPLN